MGIVFEAFQESPAPRRAKVLPGDFWMDARRSSASAGKPRRPLASIT
jgi:hypothetical protein